MCWRLGGRIGAQEIRYADYVSYAFRLTSIHPEMIGSTCICSKFNFNFHAFFEKSCAKTD